MRRGACGGSRIYCSVREWARGRTDVLEKLPLGDAGCLSVQIIAGETKEIISSPTCFRGDPFRTLAAWGLASASAADGESGLRPVRSYCCLTRSVNVFT